MKHTMKIQTNETDCVIANKRITLCNWKQRRTLCYCKQMKHTVQQETNEAHYGTANIWNTLCKCKQMKHTMQPQAKWKHYATK